MNNIAEKIKNAVERDAYFSGEHATEQLDARGIIYRQVAAGVADGMVLRERPNDLPNPVVELEQNLPDGTAVKCVWAWLAATERAKLVTVHFFDEDVKHGIYRPKGPSLPLDSRRGRGRPR